MDADLDTGLSTAGLFHHRSNLFWQVLLALCTEELQVLSIGSMRVPLELLEAHAKGQARSYPWAYAKAVRDPLMLLEPWEVRGWLWEQ